MEIKSILIKDTTREERIRIVQEGLNQCGGDGARGGEDESKGKGIIKRMLLRGGNSIRFC